MLGAADGGLRERNGPRPAWRPHARRLAVCGAAVFGSLIGSVVASAKEPTQGPVVCTRAMGPSLQASMEHDLNEHIAAGRTHFLAVQPSAVIICA